MPGDQMAQLVTDDQQLVQRRSVLLEEDGVEFSGGDAHPAHHRVSRELDRQKVDGAATPFAEYVAEFPDLEWLRYLQLSDDLFAVLAQSVQTHVSDPLLVSILPLKDLHG
ncbi:hypothetical protein Vlu01_52720 [Micromonospora lutea]|uniref:Uncharacterized protein n=1 Tax=Micromonospora lutea TaxID=419825 RepID=A0ABQ4J3Q7_9ACTN|nr:hypothetical protein Vlu01_52720 [Micromonospora lutea]